MDQIRLVSTYRGGHVPSMLFDLTGTKKIATRMVHMKSYLYSAIQKRNLMSSTKILSKKSMIFMVFPMLQMRWLCLVIRVQCRL